MKRAFTTFILLFILLQTHAQISWLPRFINRMYFDKDSTKKSSFVVIPILTSAPETGLELGGAGLYSFYSDTVAVHHTRVSTIYPYISVTTKGQSHFSVSTTYWSPGNSQYYTGAISYINYPFNFFGIGNNTRKADEESVDEKRFKLNFGSNWLLAKNFYAGFVAGGFNYKNRNIDSTHNHFYGESPIQGINGGASIYAGPSLVYDSRNNNTYTTKGMIITAYYNAMHGVFTNNGYEGGLFNIEYSQFFLLCKRLVLGLDVQEQNLTGGNVPFYLLPSLGNDEMMRGYYNGRYRDRNLIAGQTELRYRISDRFGVVGFLGTGEVAHNSFSINSLKPDYGGGIRYFFDTEKGLSIRADYGFGEKVPGESRQSGFYIGLGEAF
ncbi:MAG: polymerase [Bacteroidetes bacterium]|nr:polymerase [Bacteroidota bacterium]